MKQVAETELASSRDQEVRASVPVDSQAGCSSGWVWAGACRIGKRHLSAGGVCEDAQGAVLNRSGRLHLALADGVSGGARGDVAANALVSYALAYERSDLGGVVRWMGDGAEAAVNGALSAYTSAPGATTFACAWLMPNGTGLVTRVGDCRTYVWGPPVEGQSLSLEQILPDQTLAYMGHVPLRHPQAGNPAHMVGNGGMGQLEWREINIPQRGGVLICSDGLHGAVRDSALKTHLLDWLALEQSPPNTPDFEYRNVLFCNNLIDHAQALGSDDDVAVLLALRI